VKDRGNYYNFRDCPDNLVFHDALRLFQINVIA
jgi:hypothetical protein